MNIKRRVFLAAVVDLPGLNPDMMGRASPIVVRVYALKSDDTFNNADFFALYEQDTSILGAYRDLDKTTYKVGFRASE